MWNKLKQNKSGFSLTEVLIAVMVLTVAIVASSSLLVTLIKSNDNNSKTIQAHYFAVEGVEAVRNIRDTNWLHNVDWLGDGSKIDYTLPRGDEFGIELASNNLSTSAVPRADGASSAVVADVKSAAPWLITADPTQIQWVESSEDTVFTRSILISEYDCVTEQWCDPADDNEVQDYVLVEVTVSWDEGDKSVTLSNVLTNWKDGVL